jgi:hypothetical protein
MATVKNVTINDSVIKIPASGSNNRGTDNRDTASFKYNESTKNTEYYTSSGSWSATSDGSSLRQGLVLELDARQYREKNYRQPLLGAWTWRDGATDAATFGRNGAVSDNLINQQVDPFGNTSLCWGSYPDTSSNADGGWNSSYRSVDPRRTYRSLVWVRKAASTDSGTFYHGTNGGGSAVLRLDNGSAQGNPYWVCDGIGGLPYTGTASDWRLHVSHVLPHNYSRGNVAHPDTGVYTIADGRIGQPSGCNVGRDMRMAASTSSLRQRVYHYYSPNTAARLQWWQPRLEEVTGNEPSVQDILTNKINYWNGPHALLMNYPEYNTTEDAFTFEPSGNKHVKLSPSFGYGNTVSVTAWVKTKGAGDGGYHIICGPTQFEISIPNDSGALRTGITNTAGTRYVQNDGSGVNDGSWHLVGFSLNGSVKKAYIDGVEVGSQSWTGNLQTYVPARSIGVFGQGDGTYGLNGYLSQYNIYNRTVSANEMTALFENERARYGV